MFTDPQTVTVNAVAQTLPAVSREDFKSVYRENNGEYALVISHNEGKSRDRRTVRLNRYITTADPFIPANNIEVSHSVYLVIDAPIAGFTDAQLEDDVLALAAWLTSANVAKVLGGES